MSYAYDVNGIRASKTVDGVKHTYVYDGTQLLAERYGTTRLEFMYNESGQPHLVRYSTNSGSSYVTYYYILNQQGDVMALMDTAGELAVKYTYDPWGRVLTVTNGSSTAITSATHIANVNPIRYRSYYYDTDTQLYYLQSRYYDPEVSRFLNADAYASTGQGIVGYNMFAYCNNSPISCRDVDGQDTAAIGMGWISWAWWLPLIDGPFPFGDLIYSIGILAFAGSAIYEATASSTSEELERTDLAAKQGKSKADNDVTIKSSSRGTSASPTPPPPNKKPSLKRVSENLLKKFGLDAHEIKREYLGNKAKISRYDLSYDTKTGIIYIVTKAQEIVMMTDYNVKYLPY